MATKKNAKHPAHKRPEPQRLDEKPGFKARKVAADILGNIVHKHRPLDNEFDVVSGHSGFRDLSPQDRSLVRAIVGSALRHRGEIAEILNRVLDREIPERSGRVLDILHVAIAQMLFLDIPDRAAVSLAVDHAGADRRVRVYKGLVNGVLRRIGREHTGLTADLDSDRLNTPGWLFETWCAAYGEETALQIAAAHRSEAALDLTVKADPEEWARRLGGTVVAGRTVRLAHKGAIETLDGFKDGAWWVQDAAAALPARLMGDVYGQKVLDLCAAPGGKTAQLAAAGAIVTAVDISKGRLKRLNENMERLRLSVETVAADLRDYRPCEPVDAILLDAPCSASGTIRRHPDVAWLKRPKDIETLAALQTTLLQRVADWVKPGGILVYCTCSLQPEEGEDQIAAFLAGRADYRIEPVTLEDIGGLSECISPEGYVRTLPCHLPGQDARQTGLDGFFVARLRRL